MKLAYLHYQGYNQWVAEQDGHWCELHQSLTGLLHASDFELALRQSVGDVLIAVNDVSDDIDADVHYLAPIDQQEAWASGVTYTRSRDARTRESQGQELYNRVYDAERPELFLKALASRTVGHGDDIGIREDATWNVPEPELTLLLNAQGKIVGYTIGNDMSSRDIEGANPLYLPQAKVFDRCLGLGPVIVSANDISDPLALDIHLQVERGGETVVSDSVSTSRLHRSLETLASYLFRSNRFPHGAFLLTGTGIVPDDNFTLEAGDVVSIRIEHIGTLTNKVVRV
jgi:2-dehydro-3-deoxy-D-arabinonate dehydratase